MFYGFHETLPIRTSLLQKRWTRLLVALGSTDQPSTAIRFPCQLLSCELSVSRTILHWGREGPKRLASHCWWFRNPTFRTSLDKALCIGAKCRTSETSRGSKSSQGGPTVMLEDLWDIIFKHSTASCDTFRQNRLFDHFGCRSVANTSGFCFSTRKRKGLNRRKRRYLPYVFHIANISILYSIRGPMKLFK